MSSPELRSEGSRREYRFGEFVLDLEDGFLRRGTEEVPLRAKAFEVLTYLVERSGRLVTKRQLIEAVWPDAAITDNSLAQCLVELRRALGDEEQQLIRTVARRGYLFTASVTRPILGFPLETAADRSTAPHSRLSLRNVVLVAIPLMAIAGGLLVYQLTRSSIRRVTYTQLTHFTDSAMAAALSPDGRMIAFIRSDNWFLTPDQIYAKILPNGEAVQLTHDSRMKYNLAFSPDGSKIAYTVFEPGSGWATVTVSALGGGPELLLSNAAGLSWIGEHAVLFSQIKTGQHMGIVTAQDNRADFREIYYPPHQRAMAHYSSLSPDRKSVLAVEMDPIWQPCRLLPFDGSSAGRQVGPPGKCTSAAWSPDGRWMYFGVEVDGSNHLWRQRFPHGAPEQITYGPAEERGVTVAPDGHSLITSVGSDESAIWLRDGKGEHPLSSEGHVSALLGAFSFPSFSEDGKQLYYLLRRDSMQSPNELWRIHLDSGKNETLLTGFSILEYDVSRDGRRAVFSAQRSGEKSQIWLATLDRSSSPKRIASSGEGSPRWGADGQILFRFTDGQVNYLGRMKPDGSGRSKAVPYPISTVQGISPDRRWIIAITPFLDGREGVASMAIPTGGGTPRIICPASCPVAWTPSGNLFYVGVEPLSRTNTGKTVAIPLARGQVLPDLPASGIRSTKEAMSFPGARVIPREQIIPGPDPSSYAYVKSTVHLNLFRITLP